MSTVLVPFLQTTVYPLFQTELPLSVQTLSDKWNFELSPAMKNLYEWWSVTLVPFVSKFNDFLGKVIGVTVSLFSIIWTTELYPALVIVHDFLRDYILPILTSVWDYIANVLGPAIGTFVNDTLGWFITQLSTLYNWLEKVRAKAETTADTVGGVGSGGGGGGGGHPKRQHGGPVLAGVPYLVGEAGPELFVPNTSGYVQSNYTLNLYSNSRTERIIDDFNSMKAWARS
jgi:hypothetical protein